MAHETIFIYKSITYKKNDGMKNFRVGTKNCNDSGQPQGIAPT